MELTIHYAKKFQKEFKRAPISVREKAVERIKELHAGAHNPLMDIHPLHGEYFCFKSCNVTGDWRIIYRIVGEVLELARLGTHPQLYG